MFVFLHSMKILGLDDLYAEAHDWVEKSLSFDHQGNERVFESIIRVMGGLLSAHDLTKVLSACALHPKHEETNVN